MILIQIILHFNDGVSLTIEKYNANEGQKVYSISGQRIPKDKLLVPNFSQIYSSIWCKEDQVEEAMNILHEFTFEKIKNLKEYYIKIADNLQVQDGTKVNIRDYTQKVEPIMIDESML